MVSPTCLDEMMFIRPFQALAYRRVAFFKPPSAFALQACRDLPMWRWLTVRAGVSLTLRLICGHLLRSLLPFLTCIYDTLLDLEINKMRVSSGIGFGSPDHHWSVSQTIPGVSAGREAKPSTPPSSGWPPLERVVRPLPPCYPPLLTGLPPLWFFGFIPGASSIGVGGGGGSGGLRIKRVDFNINPGYAKPTATLSQPSAKVNKISVAANKFAGVSLLLF